MEKGIIDKFLVDLLEEKGPVPKKNILQYRYLDNAHIDSLGILGFINKLSLHLSLKFS